MLHQDRLNRQDPRASQLVVSVSNVAQLAEQIGRFESLEKLTLKGSMENFKALAGTLVKLTALRTLEIHPKNNDFALDGLDSIHQIRSLIIEEWPEIIPLIRGGYPHLHHLRLVEVVNPNNQLQRGLFAAMPQLNSLHLKFKQKTQFTPGESIPEQLIDLQLAVVQGFPEAILKWQTLRSLSVKNFSAKTLPKEIANLRHLKSLKLTMGLLTGLPNEIIKLRELLHLDISNNKFAALPESLGELPELEKLAATANQLSELPRSVYKSASIRELSLKQNLFGELSPAIANMQQLEVLNLRNNKLRSLPAEIGRLENLRMLQLRGNTIKKLPKSITALVRLEVLDLGDNQVDVLPENIGNLKALQTLELDNNKLQRLPASISELSQLQTLRCRDNRLQDFPKNLRWQLKGSVHLSGNKLHELPVELFDFPELKTVIAERNPINELPRQWKEWKNPPEIHLQQTRVSSLPLELLEAHPQLNIVLEGTPLAKALGEHGFRLLNARLRHLYGKGSAEETRRDAAGALLLAGLSVEVAQQCGVENLVKLAGLPDALLATLAIGFLSEILPDPFRDGLPKRIYPVGNFWRMPLAEIRNTIRDAGSEWLPSPRNADVILLGEGAGNPGKNAVSAQIPLATEEHFNRWLLRHKQEEYYLPDADQGMRDNLMLMLHAPDPPTRVLALNLMEVSGMPREALPAVFAIRLYRSKHEQGSVAERVFCRFADRRVLTMGIHQTYFFNRNYHRKIQLPAAWEAYLADSGMPAPALEAVRAELVW